VILSSGADTSGAPGSKRRRMPAAPASSWARIPPHTRRWWVVGTLGCALGVAFAVWWGVAGTSTGISYQDIGYHVIDDRTVDVTFEVVRPPRTRVTCLLQALDARFGSVGSAQVAVPVSSSSTVQRTARLRTTTRAVTGIVKVCAAG